MRLLALLIPLVSICPVASQASGEAQEVVGTCGDHWLKIHFNADVKTKTAKIYCSGDSQTECEITGTLIQDQDASFKIQFNEPSKGYLSIDGREHDKNISWGAWSATGRSGDEKELGLCSVNWKLN